MSAQKTIYVALLATIFRSQKESGANYESQVQQQQHYFCLELWRRKLEKR